MDTRPSPIAGTWYPANPVNLQRDIERYLAAASVSAPAGKLWGVIAPHAGYRYSGPVAAYAYKCLAGLHPDLVVIVSPMHQPLPGALLTSGHEAYHTPFGDIELDRQAVHDLDQALQARLGFGLTPIRNDGEHALEIELPFLQQVIGTFRLLPVMVRDQSIQLAEALGHALGECLRGHNTLLVASSDLSHFYPQSLAVKLDQEILARIGAFDPQGIMEAEEEGVGFACGRAAIAAVMWAARDLGADRSQILYHATSGDITGDYGSVVGYGAAAIWETVSSQTVGADQDS